MRDTGPSEEAANLVPGARFNRFAPLSFRARGGDLAIEFVVFDDVDAARSVQYHLAETNDGWFA